MDTVGKRVRAWRRRRQLSQEAAARLAGISQSYLSQIECDRRPLDRKQTQVSLAAALSVSVAELLGTPDAPGNPARDQAVAHVPAIRAALIEIGAGERRKPTRDVDAVRAEVALVTELRGGADHAALAPRLAPLLLDLAAHGAVCAPLLVQTACAAQFGLKSLGYRDLALRASELSVAAAQEHGDPAWLGMARYNLVQAYPPESAGLGQRLTAAAAAELEGARGAQGQQAYGFLNLLAGYQASIAGDAATAWAHLGEAADVAAALGEPERTGELSAGINGSWFSSTQVQVWSVSVAAELRDTGAATRIADNIDLGALPVPNRHVYLWVDLARALAAGERDLEAMEALSRAEKAAPQHFRLNPVVPSLVNSLIERARRRAVGAQFRRLARGLGLAV